MPAMANGRMQVMTATPDQIKITDASAHTTGVAQIKGEYAKVLYGDASVRGGAMKAKVTEPLFAISPGALAALAPISIARNARRPTTCMETSFWTT
jgi:hypothetical protein